MKYLIGQYFMRMRLPIELKEKAKQYFMQGVTIREILNRLASEDNIIVKEMTLRQWMWKEKWTSLRNDINSKALAVVAQSEIDKSADAIKRQLRRTTELEEKISKTLGLDNADRSLQFDTTSEAVTAFEKTIKLEKILQTGIINKQFLELVYSVVAEVINDDNKLAEIGRRFSQILSDSTNQEIKNFS